ncbi:paraquat-inducible protein A [Jannaschia seohaensis]|uniref:Paraquat-inducible protein A n=1 Tax=Jannaschia seohaensis TaxID=475081 RepID=A0A2Y9A227_9RHOB|nr:paraquat-inducible protein A [Jannaschia seohaensis]PWJ22313.1 paraquat-inducible protein A [Jannaschia seohaensis]SSA38591.1 paraquat-inducible protein A [Jannaschia seohaensis]
MDGPGHGDAALSAPTLTAREAGLVGCRQCTRVCEAADERCPRCGARLSSRDPGALQRVWAWWLAGALLFIPANTYPMLITSTVGRASEATIVGGVIELLHYGSYGVAGIVFFASVMIPVGKFVAIAYLAILVQRGHRTKPKHLLHLFEFVEWIGRWSMIDVFVVAILVALVQFDLIATINPGIAAVCFALSVVFTMLSALSFDSRAIWDRIKTLSND